MHVPLQLSAAESLFVQFWWDYFLLWLTRFKINSPIWNKKKNLLFSILKIHERKKKSEVLVSICGQDQSFVTSPSGLFYIVVHFRAFASLLVVYKSWALISLSLRLAQLPQLKQLMTKFHSLDFFFFLCLGFQDQQVRLQFLAKAHHP